TFGLGVLQDATPADLERIEAFYRDRGAAVDHEISPLAGVLLLALLSERGYRPIELTSVMFRPLQGGVRLAGPRNDKSQVRIARESELELFAQTATRGWS